MNARALRKSVRTYRAILARLPKLANVRTTEYQDAANYLRELYREFGRENVRREIASVIAEEQRAAV